MHEIKFRAWHKESKEMFDVYALTPTAVEKRENGISYVYDRRDVILMQYTGFNDSNCQEIYTGDILWQSINIDNEKLNCEYCKYIVTLEKGCFVARNAKELYPEIKLLYSVTSNNFGSNSGKIVIIGNIHDNPELKGEN